MKRLSAIFLILLASQNLVAADKADNTTAALTARPAAPAADEVSVTTQVLTVYRQAYDACYKGQGAPAPSVLADPFQNIRDGLLLNGSRDTH